MLLISTMIGKQLVLRDSRIILSLKPTFLASVVFKRGRRLEYRRVVWPSANHCWAHEQARRLQLRQQHGTSNTGGGRHSSSLASCDLIIKKLSAMLFDLGQRVWAGGLICVTDCLIELDYRWCWGYWEQRCPSWPWLLQFTSGWCRWMLASAPKP